MFFVMAPATRSDAGGIFGGWANFQPTEDSSCVGPGGRSHDKFSIVIKVLTASVFNITYRQLIIF
ncbi:hypothetical protein CWM47_20165 [Spirosoma pollinicola]|uniref:Uncharacterized protein n=1 Tax=Spirosoma pollinicola TaxID=2057025 RepID=A0A2K8Z261_9BACT|nr:hypothetical protein CWM47_20165 [Spirosoma pollinicola]